MDVKHRLDPDARLGIRLTLTIVAVLLVALPFAFLLLEVLYSGPLTHVDQRVAADFNRYNHRHDGLGSVARAVTNLGSTPVLVAVVLVAVIYLGVFHRRRRQAFFLVTTAVLGLLLNNLVKVLVGRSRPHFSDAIATAFGKSFPSGHAMNSTIVYGSLLVIAWPYLRSVARRIAAVTAVTVLVGAIAASRVVLAVHYVSDVLAGIVLGAAFTLASAAAFRTWEQEGGRLPQPIEQAPAVGEPAGAAAEGRNEGHIGGP